MVPVRSYVCLVVVVENGVPFGACGQALSALRCCQKCLPITSRCHWMRIGDSCAWCLHENHTNAAAFALVGQVSLVDSAANGRRPPIVEVVVQLPVSSAKLQLLKEEGVVLQGQGVEDVEFGL